MKWLPIETAPEVKGDCFWCLLAWGREDDKFTGEGFRWKGRWFAAASFYCLGSDRKFEWREIEIAPTHWMPSPEAPGSEPIPHDQAKAIMDEMTDEERLSLMQEYCVNCGTKHTPCYCTSDD